jgi:hypothetical protein
MSIYCDSKNPKTQPLLFTYFSPLTFRSILSVKLISGLVCVMGWRGKELIFPLALIPLIFPFGEKSTEQHINIEYTSSKQKSTHTHTKVNRQFGIEHERCLMVGSLLSSLITG